MPLMGSLIEQTQVKKISDLEGIEALKFDRHLKIENKEDKTKIEQNV